MAGKQTVSSGDLYFSDQYSPCRAAVLRHVSVKEEYTGHKLVLAKWRGLGPAQQRVTHTVSSH